ncbi:hypothetical protein BC937DRAFT_94476 [Endogone sp. FLAS-F59071]|nr:hypothetical protein BC937DRAFT_94476 [Endogone sp. FLAS-F59071]|eukprot:RUS14012.1 hypothetical protein BC937DRAFT_94476 [Endogone sp. FLAS-F59071]
MVAERRIPYGLWRNGQYSTNMGHSAIGCLFDGAGPAQYWYVFTIYIDILQHSPLSSRRKFNSFTYTHRPETDPLSPTNQAHSGAVTGLCFHPTGHYLLSTAHDERLRLWDTWTGRNALVNYDPYICNQFDQPLAPLVVAAGGAGAGAAGCDPPLVFHPSDDRQILVFDMLKGKLVKRLRGSFGRVTCVCWRTDREVS